MYILQCCENDSLYEISYEVGTKYNVCQKCAKLPHFTRGIKSKIKIQSAVKPSESLQNTSEWRHSN